MSVLLFEDHQVTQLYPVTIGRPAYAINCGCYRLIDVLARLETDLSTIVRPHLAELYADQAPTSCLHSRNAREPLLLVNAALVPSATVGRTLRQLLIEGNCGIVWQGDRVAAAVLPAGSQSPSAHDVLRLADHLAQYQLPSLEVELPLFEFPHDIIRHHLAILRENLQQRLQTGRYAEVADGVFVADGVKLGQFTVTDTRSGPILLEQGATIGPYCYLSGPVHIGAGARVIEHAALKDGVALGHTTKIGGEVEASIIEPYTNKQHHGFLGHSYLGSWINLGAGTCNSNLKNTYGQVKMEYGGQKVCTQMQFLGCIMGDYAKTAINTGIFTGKTIGVCSMLYGFVTTNVPSFVNYARSFGQVTEAPVEVMVATQARMFARRNVTQRPGDIKLLHDMYALTQHERQIAGEPLAF